MVDKVWKRKLEKLNQLRTQAAELEFELALSFQDSGFTTDLSILVYPYFGYQPCENSPVGVCVYHAFQDPAHDTCIYCKQPEERK